MMLKIFYLPQKLWQGLWRFVWNTAEFFNCNLGKVAPWVFAQMLGIEKYKQIKE